MSINGLNVTSPKSARYWSELKELSDKEKIELIALLSSSLTSVSERPASHKKGWASRFAGTWKDSRSAEEIIDDIRAARTTNTFDVKL
jgi:DNA phosphorothioation-dependent restriction protein DptG